MRRENGADAKIVCPRELAVARKMPRQSSLSKGLSEMGSSFKDFARRHTAKEAAPASPLVAAHRGSIAIEQHVSSFIVGSCSHADSILVDVGDGDLWQRLASVFEDDAALLRQTDPLPKKKPQALIRRHFFRVRSSSSKRPPPPPPPSLPPPMAVPSRGCRVCIIMMLQGSGWGRNATAARNLLHARGVPLLLVGGAGVGSGLASDFSAQRAPTHRVIDLAHSIVHPAARHARPEQRLILRLDLGTEAHALLSAHLIFTQALCRLHTMLLVDANRSAHAPPAEAWLRWTDDALGEVNRNIRECRTKVVRMPAAPPASSSSSSSSSAPGYSSASAVEASLRRSLPACAPSAASRDATAGAAETEGGRASASSYLAGLGAADEARLDQLFAKHRCSHAYLDVGSNIGVQLRKLFEPHKYRGASVLPVFDQHFGSEPSARCRVCAIGIEVRSQDSPWTAALDSVPPARRGQCNHSLARTLLTNGSHCVAAPRISAQSEAYCSPHSPAIAALSSGGSRPRFRRGGRWQPRGRDPARASS